MSRFINTGNPAMRILSLISGLFLLHNAACADIATDKAAGAAALAEGDFALAAEIYTAIVAGYPDDGEAHYRLGMAEMSLDRLDDAAVQFEAAAVAGYQPLGVAYRLARIYARQGLTEAALEQLDALAAGGFPAPQLIEDEADFAALSGNPRFQAALALIQNNRYPCRANPNNRLFDHWVGEWEVTALGQPAGTNEIKLILGGCVLFENWESVSGTSGKSFNYYDASEDHWRQIWVDDTGGVVEFTGQVRDGVMYYTATTHTTPGGDEVQHKLTFTPLQDGSIQQLWEQSTDGGNSWTVAFDGHYIRAAE
jgi:tetratricopeptide (TPR) repeat protein